MPENATVNVTVTFPGNGSTPSFQLGGSVNGQGAVIVQNGVTETITWNLNGNQNGQQVTFNSTNPIEWVGSCGTKTGNSWPANGAPTISLPSPTQAKTSNITNSNSTDNTLVYLYKINVQVGSTQYSYDPEIDQPGDPGR